MIDIGKHHHLTATRRTDHGLYLTDGDREEVLLPNKYVPEGVGPGDTLEVFVYLDHQERKVATTLEPKIKRDQFALLKCTAVTKVGAFMDWGLEKELMVPFKEQRQPMEEGRWYVVFMELDEDTDRLYASNKVDTFLQNDFLTVKEGDEVDLLVLKKTDLGFSVIVNHAHKGLVFNSDVFQELNVGDQLKGYVKTVREDGKLDITLQPVGYGKFNDANVQKVYNQLLANDGSLPLTDKSSPEDIQRVFGMSKKAFKKAVGALYKARRVVLEEGAIRLS